MDVGDWESLWDSFLLGLGYVSYSVWKAFLKKLKKLLLEDGLGEALGGFDGIGAVKTGCTEVVLGQKHGL